MTGSGMLTIVKCLKHLQIIFKSYGKPKYVLRSHSMQTGDAVLNTGIHLKLLPTQTSLGFLIVKSFLNFVRPWGQNLQFLSLAI